MRRQPLRFKIIFRKIINKVLIWPAVLKLQKSPHCHQQIKPINHLWILSTSCICFPQEQIFQKKLNLKIRMLKKRKMKKKILLMMLMLIKWKMMLKVKLLFLICKLIQNNNLRKKMLLTEMKEKVKKEKVQIEKVQKEKVLKTYPKIRI